LGDAVMALPLVDALRREWAGTHLAVAARSSVAPLFAMVKGVDAVHVLRGGGGLAAIRAVAENADALGAQRFDTALLLPNSFVSAWVASRAGIRDRWGFRADWRGRLLTRAVPRPPKPVHQAEYYLALGGGLGVDGTEVAAADACARIDVPEEARSRASTLLTEAGLPPGAAFVAMAPGAAYGKAKQWLPERFAELARLLRDERGVGTVLVGARADAGVCREIARAAPGAIDLATRTDLPTLAGVLGAAQAVVANDSGAMHLAAAVGARVVAIFGATNEKKTAPLRPGPDRPRATVVTSEVWCRPCMLRECPIDHRCMTGIQANAVFAALVGSLRS
jgi:heptosyltransferase-2